MKAVILAAGMGSRLNPITLKKPKCMVTVAGEPILAHQIRAYVNAGISEIIIVAGYKINQIKKYCKNIKYINIKIIENKYYRSTNNMYSLYLVKEEIYGKSFLLSNGDVVFELSITSDCINSNKNDLIICDKGSYNYESMKVKLNDCGYINDISKSIPQSVAYGNSIDLYKFSSQTSILLFDEMSKIIKKEKNLRDWIEVALQRILNRECTKMVPFDIKGKHWIEIDNLTDLLMANSLFNKIGQLKDKKLFLIDLDGTVYLGEKSINGANEFIKTLRKMDKLVYFLSNNSSKSKMEYINKLKHLGISASEEEMILSTDGVIEYLLKRKVKDIFIVGTKSMKIIFQKAGFKIESNSPEFVVLGYDTELNYSKLRQAAIYMNKGIELIATHPDIVCPTPEGLIPDIGSMIALLKEATGKFPFKIFGKPNPEMVSHIIKKNHVTKKETVIIGDRLYTDLELARQIGCNFICVLSGETTLVDVEDNKYSPDLLVNNIGELTDFLYLP